MKRLVAALFHVEKMSQSHFGNYLYQIGIKKRSIRVLTHAPRTWALRATGGSAVFHLCDAQGSDGDGGRDPREY